MFSNERKYFEFQDNRKSEALKIFLIENANLCKNEKIQSEDFFNIAFSLIKFIDFPKNTITALEKLLELLNIKPFENLSNMQQNIESIFFQKIIYSKYNSMF